MAAHETSNVLYGHQRIQAGVAVVIGLDATEIRSLAHPIPNDMLKPEFSAAYTAHFGAPPTYMIFYQYLAAACNIGVAIPQQVMRESSQQVILGDEPVYYGIARNSGAKFYGAQQLYTSLHENKLTNMEIIPDLTDQGKLATQQYSTLATYYVKDIQKKSFQQKNDHTKCHNALSTLFMHLGENELQAYMQQQNTLDKPTAPYLIASTSDLNARKSFYATTSLDGRGISTVNWNYILEMIAQYTGFEAVGFKDNTYDTQTEKLALKIFNQAQGQSDSNTYLPAQSHFRKTRQGHGKDLAEIYTSIDEPTRKQSFLAMILGGDSKQATESLQR